MRTVNVIEGIYFAALEKTSPAERATYLDAACQGDDALRRCVDRMLESAPRVGQFLEPVQAATVDEPPPITEKPGTVIGPYKLLQQLGEGGFGVVFLAEQDKPVRRKVALKIIKPGMDSKQVIARFESERQALAIMDHPNIAKVLDAGTTDSGRPYFVMELVKGVPLTEFCDQNKLTPRERLELFVPVCQAVQHAHQKGIIHRDLKPSNVLVTMYDDKPVPKVIDFGVAKAIEQKLTEETLFTRVGQVIGTLEYMSPEQASLNALDVDTRSDVYALGVILYELLTGSTPLGKEQLQSAGFVEMLRLIREVEPPKPSTRLSQSRDGLSYHAAYRKTDSHRLLKMVRGELDWIAMRALEKDRSRRYATASALAADVQRYLNDEQVEACPPSLSYRLSKYARRRKVEFTIATAVAATLLIGIFATMWQAIRARQAERAALTAAAAEAEQRDVAVKEKQKAQHEADVAKSTRDQFRRSHYALQVNALQTAWESGNIVRAYELLDELKPKSGEDDLRGFEWHFWDRVMHSELSERVIPFGSMPDAPMMRTIDLSGDGTRAALRRPVSMDPNTNEVKRARSPREATATEIQIIDLTTGRNLPTITLAHEGYVFLRGGFALNHDGSRMAVVYGSTIPNRSKTVGPGTPTNPGGTPVYPFQQQFMALNDRLEVYDVTTGNKLYVARGFFDQEIALSADGKHLATVEATEVDDEGKAKSPDKMVVKIRDMDHVDADPVELKAKVATRQSTLAFNHDGTRLVTALNSPPSQKAAEMHMWDVATGKELGTTTLGGTSQIRIAFSRDGARIAGVSVAARQGSDQAPNLFSPIGGFSTLGPNLRVDFHLWEVGTDGALKQLRSAPLNLPAGNRGIRKIALSPDGRHLLVPFNGGFTHVLDAATGDIRRAVKTLPAVGNAAFNAGGNRLVTASAENGNLTIKEWDADQGDPAHPTVKTLPAGPDPRERSNDRTVASADGRRFAHFKSRAPGADVNLDPKISIRDADGKEIHSFTEHKKSLTSVRISPNGQFVCSFDRAGVQKIWEIDTGKVRLSYQTPPVAPAGGVPRDLGLDRSPWQFAYAFGPNQQTQKTIILRDADGYSAIHFDDLREIVKIPEATSVALSFDGRRLFSTNKPRNAAEERPGDMKIWDMATGRQIPTEPIRLVYANLSTDCRRLVTLSRATDASESATLMKVWDLETGRVIATEPVNTNSVVFVPDNRSFLMHEIRLSSNENDTVSVWDAATGKRRLVLDVGRGDVNYLRGAGSSLAGVTFNRDYTRVVIGTTNPGRFAQAVPTVFDLTTGKRLFRLEGVPNAAATVLFSPDGKRIVNQVLSSSTGESIRFWDAVSGHELLTLREGPEAQNFRRGSVSFSPDGHRLTQNNGSRGIGSNAEGGAKIFTWDATPRAEAGKQP